MTASTTPDERPEPGSPSANPRRRGVRFSGGAAVFLAAASSACCWLPLLLVVLGLSSAGVAGLFESLRPWALATAVVALAVAWWSTLRWPRVPSEPDCCAADSPGSAVSRGSRRAPMALLTGVVLLLALVPQGLRLFDSDATDDAVQASPTTRDGGAPRSQRWRIDGMTCAGCAMTLRLAIDRLDESLAVDIDHEKGLLVLTGRALPDEVALADTIEAAGFRPTRLAP